jgi:hypothetical protein
MLPSWDALEAEPEPASDPTPKLNRKQTRMRRSVIAAPQVASEDSDIEMVEASGPSAPVPTRKNKRRARFDLSADESGSQQPESDVGKAGLKRQRSATQEQGSSERVQEGDKPVPPVQRVDLSGRIFGEDTEVSYLLVPALRNKVSFVGLCHLLI